MKKIIPLLAFILLLSTSAQAATLKENMKALGGLFKQIVSTVSDRGENTANAANADKMIALFTTVRAQVPSTIQDLPPPAREKAMVEYQRIIDLEIKSATDLKAAFSKGDNNAAAGIVASMTNDKKDGHNKFKKD